MPAEDPIEELVTRLVLEYAQSAPATRPLDGNLSLRQDLGVESLSLVALALRLGEELSVDVVESGVELGQLDTVASLVKVARQLQHSAPSNPLGNPMID